MVATAVLLLLKVPPGTTSLSNVVAPSQRVVMPVIGAIGFMVTVFKARQPGGSE
jgi:hypothetical protein